MSVEPDVKRAVSFFDGQNLYHAARESFGYTYPNYDVKKLAYEICQKMDWDLKQVRFYTGVPDIMDNKFWHYFWTSKLRAMRWEKSYVFNRSLRYRNKKIKLPDGTAHTILVGEEKGIDVRISLDIIRLAHLQEYDVALIFSQDQDLSEVAGEIRTIAREQDRWIKIACAFPISPTSINKRGIDKTDWIPIDRTLYDLCIDKRDHRPKTMIEK